MECQMCETIKNMKSDPYLIIELETGIVSLGWYQRFKGYVLFICKQHGPELHHLPYNFKLKFLEEMAIVAEAIYNIYSPDKMNYELLGNACPHLHWHLIPRIQGDTPDNGPVGWIPKEMFIDEATRPNEEERSKMIADIKGEIERLRTA